MTELYINNNPIVLDPELSFDFFSKNPVFTRQGEYTYDIDIDLKTPQNARVYYHLDRLHVKNKPTDRRAILVVDSMVLVVGTEVILSIENRIAKIQILSGYSELNYLASNGQKIRDLDFGQVPEINAAMARESLNHIYPATNYSFPQIYDQYFVNQSTDRNYFNQINRVAPSPEAISYVEGARFVAQPFLLYYVETVVSLLGYNLETNDLLNDERACRMICINGSITRNYNEMIPNWEINKFLTEVEKLFNVVFLVDKITKNVKISSTSGYHGESSLVIVPGKDVLRDFEKTYDVEETVNTDYSNVEYEDPDSDIYKYYHIDEAILKECEFREVDSWESVMNMDLEALYNKLIIFHATDTGTDFIIRQGLSSGGTQTVYFVWPVNQFRPIVDQESEDTNTIKLNITPAEVYSITNTQRLDSFNDHSVILAPIPYPRNRGEARNIEDKLNEYIENGIPENELTGYLYIAIYAGIRNCSHPYPPDHPTKQAFWPVCVNFPYMYVSGLWSYSPNYAEFFIQYADPDHTLSLRGKYGLGNLYYANSSDVDITTEYTIRFICKRAVSQLSVFLIDNKKFLCKQLKRTILANGMDEVVEGIFYEYKENENPA